MKKNLNPIFIAALLVIGFLSNRADGGGKSIESDPIAVKEAVLEAHARMTAAAQDPDAEKMFEFILDAGPGTIIQNGRLMKSRQEALDSVKNGLQDVVKVDRTFNQTYVTVLAPDAAIVTGEGFTSITLGDGRTFSSPFAVTEVFVLRDGQWKVIHGHHSVPNRL